jgi:hypothetical protein
MIPGENKSELDFTFYYYYRQHVSMLPGHFANAFLNLYSFSGNEILADLYLNLQQNIGTCLKSVCQNLDLSTGTANVWYVSISNI